jgi:transposase
MGSTRKSFTPEYRAHAVSLVLGSHRTIVDVAQGVGMRPQTLGKWVKKARGEQPAKTELDPGERAELERLREDNAELRMENVFLKK